MNFKLVNEHDPWVTEKNKFGWAQIPLEYRKRIYYNIRNYTKFADIHYQKAGTAHDILNHLFIWHESPEGRNYWETINNKILDDEFPWEGNETTVSVPSIQDPLFVYQTLKNHLHANQPKSW